MALYKHAESNARSETDSVSYVDSGCEITDLEDNKSYFIFATADVSNESTAKRVNCRLALGSTAITGSDMEIVPQPSDATEEAFHSWRFSTVITDSGSGYDDLKIQFATQTTGGLYSAAITNARLVAINLTDDLVEDEDYVFGEDTSSTQLNVGSFSSSGHATIEVDPDEAGDWILFSSVRIKDNDEPGIGFSVAIDEDGSALHPQFTAAYESWNDKNLSHLVRIIEVDGATDFSATAYEHYGGFWAASVSYSNVFALRLGAFKRATKEHSYGASAIGAGIPDHDSSGPGFLPFVDSVSFSAELDSGDTGDHWILSGLATAGASAAERNAIHVRLRDDETTIPASLTTYAREPLSGDDRRNTIRSVVYDVTSGTRDFSIQMDSAEGADETPYYDAWILLLALEVASSSVSVATTAPTITVSATSPTVSASVSVATTAPTITVSATSASVSASVSVVTTAPTITVSATSPTVSASVSVATTAPTITVSATSPTVSGDAFPAREVDDDVRVFQVSSDLCVMADTVRDAVTIQDRVRDSVTFEG